ncbi:MAG TPA: GH1 family beta-glucosidase [Acidobacteriaceae bacterium]|jgi:beta-glucosidase|nr:GH1 family beta-glucosidase [Acidobacteriaceae bacterium]
MFGKISRRSFGRLLGGSAAAMAYLGGGGRRLTASVLTNAGVAGQSAPSVLEGAFPQGFLWGTATASYQVEGAVHEGGRGASIWDTFTHTPGKIANGDTGDVADDFYHRYRTDIALMKDLGLKCFRFSVAWSRIFPNGIGRPNHEGVDFYKRLTEALLAAGIEPFCTLYHWDLPQALQDKGGWENRATAHAFGEYAGYTAGQLAASGVRHFMTMNEIRTFVDLGYNQGTFAPGLRLSRKRVAQLNHYAVLGHGLGVQAVRAHTPAGTEVGIADNINAAVPVFASPEHIAAAKRALREENAQYLTVIQEGRYTDLYLKRLGADAPVFTVEEMKTISSPMDFTGINIYQPTYVRADDSEAGYAVVAPPSSFPTMYSNWIYVGPETLYWGPKLVREVWNVPEIYVTENGTSSDDRIDEHGRIEDTDRVMYLRNYLSQLQHAVAEDVPVKGYFLWSLLDNFEWADGYGKRFGIVYVDFKTQRRTPKMSASFYRDVIAKNRIA